jgi:uncharacterized protein DUF3558
LSRVHKFTGLLAAGLLLAAGCSSGSGSAAPGAPGAGAAGRASSTSFPDPCKLVTKDEATKIIGEDLHGEPEANPDDTGGSCTFWAGSDGGDSVQVTVGKPEILKAATMSQASTLPGLGDEAWQQKGSVLARRGTVAVYIGVIKIFGAPATLDDDLVTLTRTALTRF